MKAISMKGDRYGRLTVLRRSKGCEVGGATRALWDCKCDCGNTVTVLGRAIRSGNTKSCGCLALELKTKHGMHNTPEYKAYQDAKQRCTNAAHPKYLHYGGRGIQFVFGSFEEFYIEIGRRPDKEHSIDRINNDGDYRAGNIRWARIHVQNNNRRVCRMLTWNGQTKSLADWVGGRRLKDGNANPIYVKCLFHLRRGGEFDSIARRMGL